MIIYITSGFATLGIVNVPTRLALLFFNVGVVIGQLMFVAVVAIRMFARLSLQEWRRLRVATVYVIGILATFWFLERTAAIVALFSMANLVSGNVANTTGAKHGTELVKILGVGHTSINQTSRDRRMR